MLSQSLPAIFALLVWWISTGLILFLDGLPRHTYRWSLTAAGTLCVAAVVGAVQLGDDSSVAGAYLGFAAGIAIWGFIEISFLMGVITGPLRTACPSGSSHWRRAGLALGAILYHELAIAVIAAVLVMLTWNCANRTAMWTFVALWGMRQSAKLNLFLGVRNLSEEFFPDHLRYMQTYFRRAPMNLLFPVSITALTVAGVLLVRATAAAPASGYAEVSLSLLATLVWLGTLEHWFLVLPVPVEALWRWSLKARQLLRTTPRETAAERGLAPLPVSRRNPA